MSHNYCACALEPISRNYWARVSQILKPVRLEPVLHNKRSHRDEKPAHCNEEYPRLATTRESLRAATMTQCSQKKKKKRKDVTHKRTWSTVARFEDEARGSWAKSCDDVGRHWKPGRDDSQQENGDLGMELYPTNTLNEQGPSRRVPSPAKTSMLAQCDTPQTTDMYMNLCGASEL